MMNEIINTGSTTTTINNKKVNEINWDANYNGSVADINIDMYNNGKTDHVTMKLTNDDLIRLLNRPTVNNTIDQRLMDDFSLHTKEFNKKSIKSKKSIKRKKSNKKNTKSNKKSKSIKNKKSIKKYLNKN